MINANNLRKRINQSNLHYPFKTIYDINKHIKHIAKLGGYSCSKYIYKNISKEQRDIIKKYYIRLGYVFKWIEYDNCYISWNENKLQKENKDE